MKHKYNKKAHDELAYAYYDQLMKNEVLEGVIVIYEKLLESIKACIQDAESAINVINKS